MPRARRRRSRLLVLAAAAVSSAACLGARPASVQEPAIRPGPATLPATGPAPAATRHGAASQPATQPAADAAPPLDPIFLQNQRRTRDNARSSHDGLPDGGAVPVGQIVRLADDGDGLLSLDPGPLAKPMFQRFTAGGSPAAWMLTRSDPAMQNMVLPNGGIGMVAVSNTTLTRIDLSPDIGDADLWSVRVTRQLPAGYTNVAGQSVLGSVTLMLNPARRRLPMVAKPGLVVGGMAAGAVTLYVQEWQPANANNAAGNGAAPMVRGGGFNGGGFNGGGFAGGAFGGAQVRSAVKFRASADSLADLRDAHVAEFRAYVVPLLGKVSDLSWLTPGAADVYAAFPQLPPDPSAVEQVSALLPELDADDPAARDAAADRLMTLGPPGVLAALRADPASLSAEQRGQLGRLVAAHRRRNLSASDARRDVGFLLDALEYPDDPAVRSAAKSTLDSLAGEPLAFDPGLAGDALGRAADAVRLRVQALATAAPADTPAIRPATVPAP